MKLQEVLTFIANADARELAAIIQCVKNKQTVAGISKRNELRFGASVHVISGIHEFYGSVEGFGTKKVKVRVTTNVRGKFAVGTIVNTPPSLIVD
jgi:preprotein translocase subunit YajC